MTSANSKLNSKSNRHIQNRCQERPQARVAGTPKCLSALFDATNRSDLVPRAGKRSPKAAGAVDMGGQAPTLGHRVKTVVRHTHYDGDLSSFKLLPLPHSGSEGGVSVSSTGIKWTDEYDKLLTIAVKSAPPSRWDLVRNYTGTVEWAKEVSTSKDDTNVVGNGASKKKSTATSSPQKSPGLDSPNLASSAALAGTFREKKKKKEEKEEPQVRGGLDPPKPSSALRSRTLITPRRTPLQKPHRQPAQR